MLFVQRLQNFAKCDSGAVTVDWVVLTSFLVGLGVAIITTIGNSTETMAANTAAELDQAATLKTTLGPTTLP